MTCCASAPLGGDHIPPDLAQIVPRDQPAPFRWCSLSEATFRMGSDDPARYLEDGEGPSRWVTLSAFAIAAYTVTNAQFGDFIRTTGYKTDAERYNWSFVFKEFVDTDTRQRVRRIPFETPWWLPIPRAYWAQPEGSK
jgi:sulfatase modifying factor 1